MIIIGFSFVLNVPFSSMIFALLFDFFLRRSQNGDDDNDDTDADDNVDDGDDDDTDDDNWTSQTQ